MSSSDATGGNLDRAVTIPSARCRFHGLGLISGYPALRFAPAMTQNWAAQTMDGRWPRRRA